MLSPNASLALSLSLSLSCLSVFRVGAATGAYIKAPLVAPQSEESVFSQGRRNDNIHKICVLEGVGEGAKTRENCPKTLH